MKDRAGTLKSKSYTDWSQYRHNKLLKVIVSNKRGHTPVIEIQELTGKNSNGILFRIITHQSTNLYLTLFHFSFFFILLTLVFTL